MKFAVRTAEGVEGFLLLRRKPLGWAYRLRVTPLQHADFVTTLTDDDRGGRSPNHLVFPLGPGQIVKYLVLVPLQRGYSPEIKGRFERVAQVKEP